MHCNWLSYFANTMPAQVRPAPQRRGAAGGRAHGRGRGRAALPGPRGEWSSIYIYIYIYIYIHVCIHIYIYIYIYIYSGRRIMSPDHVAFAAGGHRSLLTPGCQTGCKTRLAKVVRVYMRQVNGCLTSSRRPCGIDKRHARESAVRGLCGGGGPLWPCFDRRPVRCYMYVCVCIYISRGWDAVVPRLLAYVMLKKVLSPAREYMCWTNRCSHVGENTIS